jgi:energy-coupling factor transporter ATP-binding protein EcfA2
MQEKQKVTLYLTPDLHRQLKIRAAVADEPMSSLAERALGFYLAHPEVVEQESEVYGQTHQIHSCPECQTTVVMRDGELVALGAQPTILSELSSEELVLSQVRSASNDQGEEVLVPC